MREPTKAERATALKVLKHELAVTGAARLEASRAGIAARNDPSSFVEWSVADRKVRTLRFVIGELEKPE